MSRRIANLVFIIALCATLGGHGTARADNQPLPEYQVKAAFLYNFAKFITWPDHAFVTDVSPIIIGVLGDDPFGSSLKTVVRGKTIDGRPLHIRHFKRPEDFKKCHVLFICASEKRQVKILDQLDLFNVLTVGETERFAHKGGMINFVIDESKVKFEVNRAAAERSGLRISSKLLRVATVIDTEGKSR